ISFNDALTSIDLSSLSTHSGDLIIEGNDMLVNLNLPQVDYVGRAEIIGNPSLTAVDLSGLSDGNITIEDHSVLSDILIPANTGGQIELKNNGGLTSFAFDSGNTLEELWVADNPDLVTLDLTNLASVSETLMLDTNPVLTTIDASSLVTVGQYLRIYDNDALDSIDFSELEESGDLSGWVWWHNEVDISYNEVLSVVSMPSLTIVAGLSLEENAQLATFDAPLLTEVGKGNLTVVNLPLLVDLSGLSAITVIYEDLEIAGNDQLGDVSALHNVTSVGGDFSVMDNQSLATVDAEALRDAIGISNIGGTVTISGNAP
ncbi:MAG: hypothetical protein HN348_18235, partial [Proteobacteria bacterium]|nr:hypothetical protein [Pseudomonadota bacterium]